MINDPQQPLPSPPLPPPVMAPPTIPGRIRVVTRTPKWPLIIAIIYLVFGIGGALMAAIQIASQSAMAGMMSASTSSTSTPNSATTNATMDAIKKYAPHTVFAYSFAGVCCVLVAVAGGFLLAKRRIGVRLALIWAPLRIINGAIIAGITFMMQREQFAAIAQEMAAQRRGAAMPTAVLDVVSVGTMLFVFAWTAALPIFTLIWFTRINVRAYVATWK